MKDSFVIYTKYDEQISLLSDEQAGRLFKALIRYKMGNSLPKMDAVTNMIFSVIRQQIDFENQKYDELRERNKRNGEKGGRPSKSLINKGEEPKKPSGFFDNPNKPNGFSKNRMVLKEKETPDKEKGTQKENNPQLKEISPLFYSPQSGDKKTAFADMFYSLYPKYAKDRAKMREDVDYKKLLDEFAKSAYLRSLYTVKQINENYPCIITGDFRDKEKTVDGREMGREYMAARERFYTARRNKAQDMADEIKKRFMQDETFRSADKELNALVVKIAKAEFQADGGDDKARAQLAKLKEKEFLLKQKRLAIIELNGMSEEDLLPKYTCRKCNDTGYTEDGKSCDCYEE